MTDHDFGPPIAYLLLQEGVPVRTSDGADVGTVKRVLAMPDEDVFDGLILDTEKGDRFVDADHAGELYERGVVLDLAAEDIRHLPDPAPSPAAMTAHPGDEAESEGAADLGRALRRAWDFISGRY